MLRDPKCQLASSIPIRRTFRTHRLGSLWGRLREPLHAAIVKFTAMVDNVRTFTGVFHNGRVNGMIDWRVAHRWVIHGRVIEIHGANGYWYLCRLIGL